MQDNFLPSGLQEEFAVISGTEVATEISNQIPGYLASIMTDDKAQAFYLHNQVTCSYPALYGNKPFFLHNQALTYCGKSGRHARMGLEEKRNGEGGQV